MTTASSMQTLLRASAAVVAPMALGLMLASGAPAGAATSSGTTITNTATATYTDGTNPYTSQSNTVTTTVQNVPALTIAPPQGTPGNNPVSPAQQVTDTFTLTNVGNGPGFFQLTGALGTAEGVTAGNGTFNNFIVNVPGQPTQTLTTVAAVNTYLATGNAGGPFTVPQAVGAPTAANQITIGVQYTATNVAVGTITTLMTPTITQPIAGTAPAVTSSTVVGQYNDTVTQDARIDVQKLAVVGGTPLVPTITYTVRFNNGGARDAFPVVRNGLPAGAGITGPGLIFTDHVPQFPVGTNLTLSGTPSFVTQPAGATFIYSVDGVTWTTSAAGAVYVGVFVPSAALKSQGGASFGTNPGSSQNSVTAPQAALSFTFVVSGSTASGSANATATTNVANSLYGDNAGYIEGPAVTPFTTTNTGNPGTSASSTAVANANGNLTGSGFINSAAAPGSFAVLNGPSGFPGAVGQTNNNDDYSAASYVPATFSAAANGSTVSVPGASAAITFANTISNSSNQFDTYNLTTSTLSANLSGNALPAGWAVTFKSTGQAASGGCSVVAAGTVITSVCVPSGGTQNYQTVMTPPAGATSFNVFTPYGVSVKATSTNDGSGNTNNFTNDEFFVGGFVKMTKTQDVASGQPCATASIYTSNAVVADPGDCVRYTVTYLNVAPSGGTSNVTLNASTVVITEDGAGSGSTNSVAYTNNWAANSNGLYAVPVDSTGGTLGGYNPGPGAAGSSKFTDTIASLVAGATGNVVFKVQIK
ncbi:MAG: hypothetical protein JWN27_1615 [Candidatus Eremiobacteraeota bacterium]|nr:hypothetical protein [Candidatus Eremiobacteraeota bacterium]